jgi:alkylation response protein AidB-like acyl-CoA dehydrogenase
MTFTGEQGAFRDSIRAFCAKEVGTREQREAWLDADEESQSTALYGRLAELGWLGIAIPEEFGGSGGDYVDQTILFEELHAGLAPVKAIGATTTVAGCYRRFGTHEQKKDVLSAIAGGSVMSISISEPGAGSDVASVACTATSVDGGYLINGQKTWCSFAHLADRILLVARTGREGRPHEGLTMLEVPRSAQGIETRRIGTLGGREVNDVFFSATFVPAANVVGEVGRGFQQIMAGLDGERLLGAAVGLGWGRRALDDLLAYVKERQQFGRPIGSNQALAHRIADLAIELECARLLTYRVARAMDSGQDPAITTRLTSMAKVKTSEVARQIALEGVQMMGGYGYSTEFDMESHLRHALVLPIYAGTNEIQREIISKSLGLR